MDIKLKVIVQRIVHFFFFLTHLHRLPLFVKKNAKNNYLFFLWSGMILLLFDAPAGLIGCDVVWVLIQHASYRIYIFLLMGIGSVLMFRFLITQVWILGHDIKKNLDAIQKFIDSKTGLHDDGNQVNQEKKDLDEIKENTTDLISEDIFYKYKNRISEHRSSSRMYIGINAFIVVIISVRTDFLFDSLGVHAQLSPSLCLLMSLITFIPHFIRLIWFEILLNRCQKLQTTFNQANQTAYLAQVVQVVKPDQNGSRLFKALKLKTRKPEKILKDEEYEKIFMKKPKQGENRLIRVVDPAEFSSFSNTDFLLMGTEKMGRGFFKDEFGEKNWAHQKWIELFGSVGFYDSNNLSFLYPEPVLMKNGLFILPLPGFGQSSTKKLSELTNLHYVVLLEIKEGQETQQVIYDSFSPNALIFGLNYEVHLTQTQGISHDCHIVAFFISTMLCRARQYLIDLGIEDPRFIFEQLKKLMSDHYSQYSMRPFQIQSFDYLKSKHFLPNPTRGYLREFLRIHYWMMELREQYNLKTCIHEKRRYLSAWSKQEEKMEYVFDITELDSHFFHSPKQMRDWLRSAKEQWDSDQSKKLKS